MRIKLLSVFCLIMSFYCQAQEKVDTVATPVIADKRGHFIFSGYLDTYYFGNFNNPKSQSNLGMNGENPGNARAFDQKAGQFGIGLVQAKAMYSASKVDAVFDMAFGPFADLADYGNKIGLLGSGSTALAIKQAYITLKATPKLSFTVGQFGTHIGYEVIDAPVNYNYSLSNLFNNGPFYHVGLKAQYAFSDRASLMVGLANNVDNLYDNNKKKGFISQFFVAPVSGWNVYLNAIVSDEATISVPGVTANNAIYSLYDLATTYQVTPKLFFGLNAAKGFQKGDYQGAGGPSSTKTWGGWALYTNYAVTDKVGLGTRYEYFNNTGGVRGLTDASGNGASVKSITLTGNIKAADGYVLLKPELRIDTYSANKFEKNDGSLTPSQTTLGMAAIFKF